MRLLPLTRKCATPTFLVDRAAKRWSSGLGEVGGTTKRAAQEELAAHSTQYTPSRSVHAGLTLDRREKVEAANGPLFALDSDAW